VLGLLGGGLAEGKEVIVVCTEKYEERRAEWEL